MRANKLQNLIDNVSLTFDLFKDYPKRLVMGLILACLLIYSTYQVLVYRVPNAVSCTYKAYVVYSLDSESWRYNWIPSKFSEQCQRKRADGSWLSLERVTDVGIQSEEVEDFN